MKVAGAGTARSVRIDVLRGIAILSVLILHFSLTYSLSTGPLADVLPPWLLRALIVNGNYGVTLFFVISGFLITSNNLLRYGRLRAVNLREFYTFRFARIIPPLIPALAIIVVLGLMGAPSFVNCIDGQLLPGSYFVVAVLSVLTFWHNVLMEAVGYFNYCLNIYWSLSVEEVFYLTFPAACLLLKRNRWIVAVCLAAIVVGPVYRAAHRQDELYFVYGYAACFDAIAFGCLAALIYPRLRIGTVGARALRIAGALGLAATYLAGIDGHEALGFTGIALSAVCLLVHAFEDADGRRRLPLRLIAWFGRHSYELYLFHIIVLGLMRDWVPKAALARVYQLPYFALFLLLSALLAAAVSRYYAEPLNRGLRARLRAGDATAAPVLR